MTRSLTSPPESQQPQVPLLPTAAPGSYPDVPGAYASVVDFIGPDPSRLLSRERDFGLRWRDGRHAYRAAWIEATRELYIVQLGSPERGGGHVELLAVGVGLTDLERWLERWQDRIDEPDSLLWLRRQVTRGIDAGQARAPSPAGSEQRQHGEGDHGGGDRRERDPGHPPSAPSERMRPHQLGVSGE